MAGKFMKETLAKLQEAIAKNPGNAEVLISGIRRVRAATVAEILEQHYTFNSGELWVERDKNVVNIEWRFFEPGHQKYHVSGTIEDVCLIPDPKGGADDFIVREKGNGSVRLELEEGCIYYFTFGFLDQSFEGKKEAFDKKNAQSISFQVGIPLSNEKRDYLETLKHPDKRLIQAGETILKIEDTFDELCEIGIKRIKAKKLSPEEENDRINRFVARIGMFKDDL